MLTPSFIPRIIRALHRTPILLIVFATILNLAVVSASFYAEHHQEHSSWRHHAKYQESQPEGFWPFVFSHPTETSTALIAVFNALLVYVTYRLVTTTEQLWRAGIEQSRLTQESIELGRQEFAATHRPKIFVQSITMNFLNDNSWECRLGFFIANGGDTDATVIGYVADPYWHEEPTFFAPESVEGQFNFLNDIIIPPGGRSEITSAHVFDIREPGFSRANLFAIGRVEYRGTDQARRLTGFCREYINDTRMWQKVKNDAYEYTY